MDNLQISYTEMHNILKSNTRLKLNEKKQILATSIFQKFGIVCSDDTKKAVMDRLSKSFINNYVTKWKSNRNRVYEFEKNEKEWLKNNYKPFKDLNLQDKGLYYIFERFSFEGCFCNIHKV